MKHEITITLALLTGALSPAVLSHSAERPDLRVVFSGLADGGSWDLWLGSADGSYLERVTDTPGIDERTPVLSQDRKLIAFTTSQGDLNLYDIGKRTSRLVPLAQTGRICWPAWGTDASTLYFVEVLMGKGPDEGRIWRLDLATGKTSKVVDEPEVEGWPSARPDGALLYTVWTQSQSCHLSTRMRDANAPSPLWDRSLSLSGATWLSDGRIAAVARDAGGQKLLLFKSGKLERRLDAPGASGRPVPYGQALLLTRIIAGAATIDVIDLATGHMHSWAQSAPPGLVQTRDPDFR